MDNTRWVCVAWRGRDWGGGGAGGGCGVGFFVNHERQKYEMALMRNWMCFILFHPKFSSHPALHVVNNIFIAKESKNGHPPKGEPVPTGKRGAKN